MDLNFLKPKTISIIRYFLAVTFLAQGVRALSRQPDFYRLVAESPVFNFLPDFFTPALFLTLVGVFDIAISILLFSGKAPRVVAIHGFIWICLVIGNSLVIGRILETIDSVGYLGGLLALMVWDKDKISC